MPGILRSKHDTDVGLVKAANPIKIELKPNVRLPRRAQYPLKSEAEEGTERTIRGLATTIVLVETHSSCNTPILPVQKSDKSKWTLVHDFHVVSLVIKDRQTKLSNYHTLLSNLMLNILQ